jgi:hypothetical protein
LAENCPHCPRCAKENDEYEGDCYETDDGSDDESKLKSEFDRVVAALAYLYYRLALFDVVAVLTMSRFGKAAYSDNPMVLGKFFLSEKIPLMESCYHPAWSLRKVSRLLDIVSGATPIFTTKPKTSKDKSRKGRSAIGWKEEEILAYKVVEPYFASLVKLFELDLDVGAMFSILENSETYRPMFRLDFSTLRHDPSYKSVTSKVASLMKNDKFVGFALSKVRSFAYATDKSQNHTEEAGYC